MKLTIEKYDPSGNTTAIVTTPVETRLHALLAQKIMARKELGIEQVGYAQVPQRPGSLGRLAMMGGEFCGNGSRCFAYHLAMEHIGPVSYTHLDVYKRQSYPIVNNGDHFTYYLRL